MNAELPKGIPIAQMPVLRPRVKEKWQWQEDKRRYGEITNQRRDMYREWIQEQLEEATDPKEKSVYALYLKMFDAATDLFVSQAGLCGQWAEVPYVEPVYQPYLHVNKHACETLLSVIDAGKSDTTLAEASPLYIEWLGKFEQLIMAQDSDAFEKAIKEARQVSIQMYDEGLLVFFIEGSDYINFPNSVDSDDMCVGEFEFYLGKRLIVPGLERIRQATLERATVELPTRSDELIMALLGGAGQVVFSAGSGQVFTGREGLIIFANAMEDIEPLARLYASLGMEPRAAEIMLKILYAHERGHWAGYADAPPLILEVAADTMDWEVMLAEGVFNQEDIDHIGHGLMMSYVSPATHKPSPEANDEGYRLSALEMLALTEYHKVVIWDEELMRPVITHDATRIQEMISTLSELRVLYNQVNAPIPSRTPTSEFDRVIQWYLQFKNPLLFNKEDGVGDVPAGTELVAAIPESSGAATVEV